MANSLWTIEEFACPLCGMNYSATREEHTEKHSGSFRCHVCKAEVHAWADNHHFFDWKAIQSRPPVFGRRWGVSQV